MKNTLNILMVSTELEIGGVGRHIVDLANGLAEKGHQVWVSTSGGVLEDELAPGVVHCVLPFDLLVPLHSLILPNRTWLAYKAWSRLRAICKDHKIDIVHAHAIAPGFFARLARPTSYLPVVLTCHGVPDAMWPSFGARARVIADHFIGVSQDTTHRLKQYAACTDKQITTINYGIGVQERLPISAKERQNTRAAWQASEQAGVVVTVARLCEQKGQDILLRAIPQVLAVHPETKFVLVGDGPMRQECDKLISEYGIQASVFLVGAQRDIWAILQSSDLFCLPSRYEALPLVIPEAYVAGLPVLATAVNGVPEIVRHGKTGFLVPEEDPGALAQMLIAALSNRPRLKQMGRNARAYGNSSFFSNAAVQERIEGVYDMLITELRAAGTARYAGRDKAV